jgi:FKBP-type peptidyl-prolyl cis-trans isomerase FklB
MFHIVRTIAIIMLLSGNCLAGDKQDPADEQSKLSYSIGYQIGSDFMRQEIDIDPQIILQGVLDSMKGSEPAMSVEEMRNTLVELKKSAVAVQKKKNEELAEKNLASGRVFLSENTLKTNVVTLPSGLQYKIISEGTGDSPVATDIVEVNYRGTLIDGTEFDSSAGGEPVSFPLNQVISGWTEGVQLMNVGSKFMFYLPSEMAYGSNPPGPPIGPDSALIFEVELVGIQSPQQ